MVEIRERRIAPWIWVLIVLLALILIFVVWWVVAASNTGGVVVVPGPSQPTAQPTQPAQPSQPSQPSGGGTQQPTSGGTQQPAQPVVVQPQPPINIYIENKQPAPKVTVAPKGQQPPSTAQNAQQVDLPGAFKYQGKTWNASSTAVMSSSTKLKDIGVTVDGKPLYADQDAKPPYDQLYIETSPGSGIFLLYD